MNLLITSIGKRVQLIKYLKKSCTIVGVDAGELAPAVSFVDKFYKIPKCSEEGYIEILLDICKNEKIEFLIPLHELEFNILCLNREKFKAVGTILLLSHTNIIDICQDKLKTYKFFVHNDINTPKSYSRSEIKNMLASNEKIHFPLIIKPINGMGSADVFKINNNKELEFFIEYIKEPIIQEFIEGIEYTIDVLCDLKGHTISIVPRERLEVRSGEVSKSRTVKDKGIIKETHRLMECLTKYGKDVTVIGPYTIQCKITPQNEMKFIEINPRFGGGVPLTFEAGVDYGNFLDIMGNEREIKPIIGEFEEITMLRYDDAIFIK